MFVSLIFLKIPAPEAEEKAWYYPLYTIPSSAFSCWMQPAEREMLHLSDCFQDKAAMWIPPDHRTQNPKTEKTFGNLSRSQFQKAEINHTVVPTPGLHQTVSASDLAHAHADTIIYHYIFFFKYRLISRLNKPLMQEQLCLYFWRKGSFVRPQTFHLT